VTFVNLSKLAELSNAFLPLIDGLLNFGHLDDPLLTGDRLEDRSLIKYQDHVPCGDERQFGERPPDGRKDPLKLSDALTNTLERYTRVQQFFRRPEGNKIREGIAGMTAGSAKTRFDKTAVIPVLNLAPGQTDDLADLMRGEEVFLIVAR